MALEQITQIPITTNKRLNGFKRILLIGIATCVIAIISLWYFRNDVLTILLPFLPLDDGKTAAYYQDLYNIVLTEFAWGALVLAIAYLICENQKFHQRLSQLNDLCKNLHLKFAVGLIVLFALLATIVAIAALEQFPNSADEYVYLYQAETLSNGKLWYPASPVEEGFRFNHIAEKDGVRVGRFPPGWPLLMGIFIYAGVPAALVNVVLGVLALFVFYKLALKRYGPVIAVSGIAVLVASGFFIFNAASFFSHTSCLFEVLIFVYGIYLYLDKKQPVFAIMAGAAIGLMLITRYYTAALVAIPMCVMIFHREGWKSIRFFLWIAIGAIPFFLYLLWYNYSITGNALAPVTVWAYKDEGLGFVNGHTIWKGMEHIVRRTLMFVYWVSPVVLILYVIYFFRKGSGGSSKQWFAEDYMFPLLIFGYLFYYEIGGNQYGPRFYFEAFPFVVLFVVRTLSEEKTGWAKSLLIASVIVMVVRLPLIAHREHKIITERMDVYQQVADAKIANAVVFISNGTSVLRPMPSGDLTRNDKYYNASVLYAIDEKEFNAEVMNHFKGRSFYRYIRRDADPTGILVPMPAQ